jgi:hypothetical protein
MEGESTFDALTRGQQLLGRKIVDAGLATTEEVVAAFVERDNPKIGVWKRQLEKGGVRGYEPNAFTDGGGCQAGRAGVARSPWNFGFDRPS